MLWIRYDNLNIQYKQHFHWIAPSGTFVHDSSLDLAIFRQIFKMFGHFPQKLSDEFFFKFMLCIRYEDLNIQYKWHFHWITPSSTYVLDSMLDLAIFRHNCPWRLNASCLIGDTKELTCWLSIGSLVLKFLPVVQYVSGMSPIVFGWRPTCGLSTTTNKVFFRFRMISPECLDMTFWNF